MQNTSLRLSCHRTLIGAIPKKLKGLKVKIEKGHLLVWHAYFDQAPTEEEKENLSVACTEVIADIPNITAVDERYMVHPGPLRTKDEPYSNWAFFRWEQE